MNILLISPYFSPMVGGVETHLDDLRKYFNKQKHKVYIRTYKAFGVKARGASCEKNSYIDIHRFWWPDFNLIYKLERYPILKFLYISSGLFFDCLLFLIKKHNSIDVIQAHGLIAALIGVILGKLFNKKIVVNTHVGFKLNKGFITKIIRWTLLNSDRILVLTSGIKVGLVNLGIPGNKIDIYHYWVDGKRFNIQKNAKSKLGWEKSFVVLFVGRLLEVKGVYSILNLAKKMQNVVFVIIGSGPLEEELKQKSKDYENIKFLGGVNNQNLPLYYSAADLLLIPSKIIKQEYEEGIPRVMIEALFCGLPIVSTKTGGIPDVFCSKIGQMVEDELVLIRKTIIRYYRKRNLIKDASKNCRPFALKYFGINNAKIIEDSLKSQ